MRFLPVSCLAALATLASTGCSDPGPTDPSAANDPAAGPAASAVATSSCTVETLGPYLVRTRWSGLSVYTVRLILPSVNGDQVYLLTLNHPIRTSTTSAVTLGFEPSYMELFNKRGVRLALTACVSTT
jgi:hypothetical protein